MIRSWMIMILLAILGGCLSTGCGTRGIGQILAGLVVDNALDGTQPVPSDGDPGLACWDFDGTGDCNGQDWNGPDGVPDGVCDAWDCQGQPGAQGEQGPQGLPGEAGPPGADGADGAVGAVGPQGPRGPAGATGDATEEDEPVHDYGHGHDH